MGDNFLICVVQVGQHFYVEPVGFCGDFEKRPCAIFPIYCDKPAK